MSLQTSIKNLAAVGLNFSYDQQPVLENISFQATPGELIAIVGPNGCGKSTLLRLLLGELTPTSGTVQIDDKPASSSYGPIGLAQRIAIVPQQIGGGSSDFGYTVREIILMARHAANAHTGWAGRIAMGFETEADLLLAERFMWAADVHHLVDRPLNTLSGGERQRVAIARAFTQNTPILLLDEPTSALDLFHQLELLEQLREAVQQQQRTVLLVTHDLNLAWNHATRTLVMDRGRIIADGPTRDVLIPSILEPVYQVKVQAENGGGLSFSRSKIQER